MLKKFAEIRTFPNVIEYTDKNAAISMTNHIDSDKYDKIVLELACGAGDYTISLAATNPNNLYIGVDVQGERIWNGAKFALENNLDNVLFLRSFIENLQDYIEDYSIDEIWITFPDPFPKTRHEKKRLTNELFLKIYQNILKPGGKVNLKTDSEDLYRYSLKSIKQFGARVNKTIKDIYAQESVTEVLNIKTKFELKWLTERRKIYYLGFSFN